jgi:non-ribosomal peptide synthetase component F
MVVMQNFDVLDTPKLNLAEDILFEKYEHNSDHTKYDLTFSFAEINDQLQLELEYNTDLFNKATIAGFVDRLEAIFQTTLTNPRIKIEDISVLGEDELKILTSKADQTHIPYDIDETILSRFNSVVSAFSDKVAVKYNDVSLTYAQLDDQSGRLAGYIKKNYALQKEDLIVLHLNRSPQMLVSILAVLKAGAAYVPVDPSYPASRIEYIVNDSSPALVISDKELDADRAKLIGDARVLNLEGNDFTEEPYQEIVAPDQLAYIIYTSGTTGNPKGVQIEHGHVNRLLFNSEDIFDFNEKDVWTMFHSYCFDFSVWEMYGALLKGGSLVVVPKEIAQDSVSFFDLSCSFYATIRFL